MAFPADPLPIKGEMFINGAWTNITSRIRRDADVVISGRGRANEQSRHTVSSCNFTLNNRDGFFSPRNPNGTNFGRLTKNMPFRVSVTETTPFLFLPPADFATPLNFGKISTTDKAVLDITGDIDVRIELEFDRVLEGGNTRGQMLAGKYEFTTGNNRSWFLYTTAQGNLRFGWSALGTSSPLSTGTYATSTAPVPSTPQRIALRATLDVNNGSGGYTVAFYTATSLAGPWTALGSSVVRTAGVTSIFSSSAPVEVGRLNSTGLVFTDVPPVTGRIYGFEMYNGIAGTLVADLDVTARSPGDTSWSDGLGTPNTWTVSTPAEVTNSNYRYAGEISELPQRWDNTGTDIFVPTTASTIGRRLSQGQSPLQSALFLNLSQYALTGYFPLEDESQSEQASNYLANGRPGDVVDVTFGSEPDLPASAGVARINSAASRIKFYNSSGAQGTAHSFLFYFNLQAVPATNTPVYDMFFSNGSLRKITFTVTPTTYQFVAQDWDLATVGTINSLFGSGADPNQWVAMRIQVSQSGGNILMEAGWYPILSPVIFGSSTSFAGTVGRPTGTVVGGNAGLISTQYAHGAFAASTLDVTTSEFTQASNAYVGEAAGKRFLRLLRQSDEYGYVVGDPNNSELMGPQTRSTLLDSLRDCVDTDGGMLDDPRHRLGIVMRTRASLYSQSAAVALNYDSSDLSGELAPTDDDQLLRNFVTVTRPLGGSATAEQTTGVNNTSDPTASTGGVGKYDTAVTKNVSTDSRLANVAEQEVFLGTWDEARYPGVQVNLERQNFYGNSTKLALTHAVVKMNIGDRLTLADLPVWCGPEDAEVMIQGYTETLRNRGWIFRWNTSPYGPYLYVNDLTLGTNTRYRAAANGTSKLNAGITSTANSFVVKTAAGNVAWGDSTNKPGNFPLDIFIGGERMTVGAISVKSTTAQLQTFSSVTRSVNGIVKSHLVDAEVQVADVFYAAL